MHRGWATAAALAFLTGPMAPPARAERVGPEVGTRCPPPAGARVGAPHTDGSPGAPTTPERDVERGPPQIVRPLPSAGEGGGEVCRPAPAAMKVTAEPSPAAEPPVALSVGLGLTLALTPMVVGGGLAAMTADVRTRRRSLEALAGGLALAPIVSHLVAGERTRAAVFGSVTVSAAVLSAVLLESVPQVLDDTKHPACVVLGGALAALLVTSGYGLVDSLMAGERVEARARLQLAPVVGPGTLAVGVRGGL
jgi:hypothetical protein